VEAQRHTSGVHVLRPGRPGTQADYWWWFPETMMKSTRPRLGEMADAMGGVAL
jgi:hypothetical protein